MNVKIVFVCDACPSEKDLDFLSRPIGLRAVNGKGESFATQDRAVVHASGFGIGVAAHANGRAVPAGGLRPARIDRSRGWSRSCVRQGRADNDWVPAESSLR